MIQIVYETIKEIQKQKAPNKSDGKSHAPVKFRMNFNDRTHAIGKINFLFFLI